jgi:transposase
MEQKRQIVEATLVPGASMALVARERGVNANQMFAWRKSYQQGLLGDRGAGGAKLLTVHVAGAEVIASASGSEISPPRSSGAIHVEFLARRW